MHRYFGTEVHSMQKVHLYIILLCVFYILFNYDCSFLDNYYTVLMGPDEAILAKCVDL